ncbi:hypothetical protein HHK36_013472 [Tetracentron sinense]|uniref:BED-type domain-containing protein n=1 Tax=Tetracentron sinense TaxID=13715 RepID=A0A834ZAC1_TETSI|nr:hypothetical protein HHK36_013472 [Tetracentron sinense]
MSVTITTDSVKDVDDSSKALAPVEKKLTSKIWLHFERSKTPDGAFVATCKYCKRKFNGSNAKGTSHLMSHAISGCKKKPYKLDVDQHLLTVTKDKEECNLKCDAASDGSSSKKLKEEFQMYRIENPDRSISIAWRKCCQDKKGSYEGTTFYFLIPIRRFFSQTQGNQVKLYVIGQELEMPSQFQEALNEDEDSMVEEDDVIPIDVYDEDFVKDDDQYVVGEEGSSSDDDVDIGGNDPLWDDSRGVVTSHLARGLSYVNTTIQFDGFEVLFVAFYLLEDSDRVDESDKTGIGRECLVKKL